MMAYTLEKYPSMSQAVKPKVDIPIKAVKYD